MFELILVVSLKSEGGPVGTLLRQFYCGQPLVQGILAARNGHDLTFTHFTPGRCIQYWEIVRDTGPAVSEGPNSLWRSIRQSLAMFL